MKFLVSPSPLAASRARPPVRIFLLFAALLLAGLVLERWTAGGLSPAGVRDHYLGSGAPSERLPVTALWEELHAFSFFWGFLLLMLGSLLVVSPISGRLRSLLTFGAAGAALVDLATPFLVVQLPGLAALRSLAFVCTVALLVASAAVVFFTFGRPPAEPAR